MPTIRPLQSSDAWALGIVEAESWRHAYARLLPPASLVQLQSDALARRWRRRLHGRPGGAWGVEEDGVVVAYATAGPARDPDLEPGFAGELAELYVHPGWQGRGLGTPLLAHAWQQLAASGMRWGVLWVLRDNLPARAFYERHGMSPDGATRRHRVAGGRVPTVRYARPLQHLDLLAVLAGDADLT